jgi:DnaJ-class molecular chaperone
LDRIKRQKEASEEFACLFLRLAKNICNGANKMKKTENGGSVSYYDILQVSPAASDHDIRSAYYKLAKRFHPDRNPQERKLSELRFRLINEAYANLKNPADRMRYNQILKRDKKTCRALKKSAGNDNINPAPSTKGWLVRTLNSFFGLGKNQHSKGI